MNISKYFPDFHLKNKGNIITVGRLEPDTCRIGYETAQSVEQNRIPSGQDISIVIRKEPDTFRIRYY
jgi:hypothetical protein